MKKKLTKEQKIKNQRMNFIFDLLTEYATINGIILRSTSDLSPLEEWLILKIFDNRNK